MIKNLNIEKDHWASKVLRGGGRKLQTKKDLKWPK